MKYGMIAVATSANEHGLDIRQNIANYNSGNTSFSDVSVKVEHDPTVEVGVPGIGYTRCSGYVYCMENSHASPLHELICGFTFQLLSQSTAPAL